MKKFIFSLLFFAPLYGFDCGWLTNVESLINTSKYVVPYSSTPYTKLNEGEIQKCKQLTFHPEWGFNAVDVQHYYNLHEESQVDRNLGFIATNLIGSIIHGDIDSSQLALQLNAFDIRKLLKEGVYENATLSLKAQALILDALNDLPYVLDIHLHNLGYDEGNYLNPKSGALAVAPCLHYFKFMALRYAAGMRNPLGSTNEARLRIHLYAGHFPKLTAVVLPIHKVYLENGMADWKATGCYLKNYPSEVTASSFYNPFKDSQIVSAVSIHPLDPDWKQKMIEAHQKGTYLIKWMPPQGIFPDHPSVFPFYKEMATLKMTLIAHSGPEHGIPTNDGNSKWQDSGNPLRFRKALEYGVNVIFAHSGHHDMIPDLDDPEKKWILGSQLFLRIAREASEKNKSGVWKGKAYGDLAAVTTHYGPKFIEELLIACQEKGVRLIYGSDYPYTNLIQPQNDAYEVCADYGLLEKEKIEPLKEIRDWNPLLANFIFTKNLALKKNNETLKFPLETFTGNFGDAPLHLFK